MKEHDHRYDSPSMHVGGIDFLGNLRYERHYDDGCVVVVFVPARKPVGA